MLNNLYKHIEGDKAIWAVVMLLALLSTLVVYSSIVTLAYKHHDGNTIYYLFRHGMFLFIGLGIIYALHRVRFKYYSRIAQLAIYVAIPLLAFTLLFGIEINDAKRWLMIPVINQTFQTSDLAKLALIMFVARALSQNQGDIKDLRKGFLPVIVPIFLVCGLILPANLSTAAVLFSSCLVLMFIGRVSLKYIAGMMLMGAVGMMLVLSLGKLAPEAFPRVGTWANRMETFLGLSTEEVPAVAVNDQNTYQIEQSKIAIATGGILGKMPGNSTQRNFLPHPYSDFIFAIIVEEYGLLGGAGVILLYLILLYRAVQVVRKSPGTFGAFLVIGIMFNLVFQAMINMAVAVNLLPVTGQPLPMVSMGGTSIWFTCMAIGVILSVSRGIEGSPALASGPNKRRPGDEGI